MTVPPPLLAPIYLRRATPNDGPALRAMFARCSAESLHARFLTATTGPADEDELVELVGDMRAVTAVELYVDTVVRSTKHATVLAWQDDRVLAAGSILPDDDATAEAALIIEDAWQSKGLGSLMAAMLAEVTALAQMDYLCAYLGTGNVRARKLITRFCPQARFLYPDAGVVDVVIPVAAISADALAQHQIDSTGRWS
ncbi:N-acetyltransferase family protein [Lentzea chajnantorensis]